MAAEEPLKEKKNPWEYTQIIDWHKYDYQLIKTPLTQWPSHLVGNTLLPIVIQSNLDSYINSRVKIHVFLLDMLVPSDTILHEKHNEELSISL